MARKTQKFPAGRPAHGVERHPDTGEKAQPGFQWVRNVRFGGWQQEAVDTPYYCSVSSETYWCS